VTPHKPVRKARTPARTRADPHRPLSPPEVVGSDRFALPAYISNGLIGLRLVEAPRGGGVAILNGFVGEHPEEAIEAAARSPFPLFGDLTIDGVSLSQSPELLDATRQSHDFATGELTTRGTFRTTAGPAEIEVVAFCCRSRPTLVCQEIRVTPPSGSAVEVQWASTRRGSTAGKGAS